MKKNLIIMIAVAMTMMMTSCGTEAENTDNTDKEVISSVNDVPVKTDIPAEIATAPSVEEPDVALPLLTGSQMKDWKIGEDAECADWDKYCAEYSPEVYVQMPENAEYSVANIGQNGSPCYTFDYKGETISITLWSNYYAETKTYRLYEKEAPFYTYEELSGGTLEAYFAATGRGEIRVAKNNECEIRLLITNQKALGDECETEYEFSMDLLDYFRQQLTD